MKKHTVKKNDSGMALVLAMFIIVIVAGALYVAVLYANNTHTRTNTSVNQITASEVAKSGIELGIRNIWDDYVEENNGAGNLASFNDYIETLVPNNEDLNGNGMRDEEEKDSNGNGVFEINDPVTLISVSDPYRLANTAEVVQLTAIRNDDISGSIITLCATGRFRGVEQTLEQRLRISGKLFQGFEFAILAENINCILCHAKVTAIDLDRNTDPDMYGNFDRTKVATLQSLLYRTGSADSKIAGTLYTRGDVMDQSGNQLSAAAIESSSLKSYAFNQTSGKLLQDSSGRMTLSNLHNADTDAEGLFEPFHNLYKNYPDNEAGMTDGVVPSNFPSPFPDLDGDRYVDPDEFDTVANAVEGSIQGGVIYGVQAGGLYAETALPGMSNSAEAALMNSGTYAGNAVLVGTEANPLIIDGDITISGDLIIRGVVRGTGKIMVGGNTYVVGDVTYDDAPGEFGVAVDGTQNALALVSGGSILMGDYLTVRGKNDTSQENWKYPDSSYSIRMRNEHLTKYVNGQKLEYGYFDPGAIDAGEYQSTMIDANGVEVPRQGQQFSFTTSELMLFNNKELQKALADPNYVPRFYGLREGQPNNLYVYDSSDEHSVRYSEGGVKLLSDYMVDNGIPLDILNRAAIHYMNPAMNWISEEALRQIWWDDEQSRGERNSPFRFDGLLYSNNAIFAITRSYVRHGSYTEGAMEIRGALICPDLGILVPGTDTSNCKAFELQYDRKMKDFLRLEDPSQVTFSRTVFRWLYPADTQTQEGI